MTAGLVTAHDLTLAIVDTLRTYLPAALANVAPPGLTLPTPRTYARPSIAAARLEVADLPAVVVSPTGLSPAPGDVGPNVTLAWTIDIGCLVRSTTGTYEDTMRDTQLYVTALYLVLHERGDLGGFAREAHSLTESYDEADASAGRTLGEGHVTAVVVVDDARRYGSAYTVATFDPALADGIPATTTTVTIDRA